MKNEELEVFVPGRICIFGEHSDWAGGHRRTNSSLVPGSAIICGTNQGLYARVRPHPDRLIFRSSFNEDGRRKVFDMPLRTEMLLTEARKGGYFSYIAGVAYEVLTHNSVRGLEIDNYRTDLPVKKGLSSSAAVCVLMARSFNLVYDLKMTVRGEMEYAYRGEIRTPSRCGRLDQGCACGERPVLMEFDGDSLGILELPCGADFHFIIADLKGSKDTVRILAALSKAFPFAENEVERNVQEYLGPMNSRILAQAVEALKHGDVPGLGALMNEAQTLFDRFVAPACPDQLTSPILHRVLTEESLKPFVCGGKGVGSQGDGSVQFLARDASCREKAIEILEKTLGFTCLRLTVARSRKVRKAVITAAGYGTRLFPMTSVVRKEFLPVVDRHDRMIPLVMANVEEAIAAGIEQICIIIQESDRRLFEDFFGQNVPQEHFDRLSQPARESLLGIREIGKKIFFKTQLQQRGLGHAVQLAREWVGDEPFLLLLGDHLFVQNGNVSCAKQLIDQFEELETNLVGLQASPESEIDRFGTVGGVWLENVDGLPSDILEISHFKEKPDPKYAAEHLTVMRLPEKTYLTLFGLYILKPGVFAKLDGPGADCSETTEIQLTDALEELRREQRFLGFVIDGERIDIGLPAMFVDGLARYSGRRMRTPG